MGHPDRGLMQALLDGEVQGQELDEVQTHLTGCQECRSGFDTLKEASERTAEALGLLDTDPSLEHARSRFEAYGKKRKESRRRTGLRPFPSLPFSLPRAASITLLLTAGAVAALPGSPARRWMTEGWQTLADFLQEPVEEGAVPASPQGQEITTAETELPETGASIPALGERVEIWIHDLSSDAELRILWTDGTEAWAYAGEGTRFNGVAGRLDAYSPPGAVRLEIPRSLGSVVVRLDGRILLQKSGGEVEILGPIQERTPSEILFETPGGANEGMS